MRCNLYNLLSTYISTDRELKVASQRAFRQLIELGDVGLYNDHTYEKFLLNILIRMSYDWSHS